MSDDLDKLIDAVEAGIWSPTLCGKALPKTASGMRSRRLEGYGRAVMTKGSLNHAKALHDALLPGWKWYLWTDAGATVFAQKDRYVDVCDGNTARAWLLAILKAYRHVRNG